MVNQSESAVNISPTDNQQLLPLKKQKLWAEHKTRAVPWLVCWPAPLQQVCDPSGGNLTQHVCNKNHSIPSNDGMVRIYSHPFDAQRNAKTQTSQYPLTPGPTSRDAPWVLPSNSGRDRRVRMNLELLLLGPRLAMESKPLLWCGSRKFSSSKVGP